jgi:nicotinamidase/pyrazinamidase
MVRRLSGMEKKVLLIVDVQNDFCPAGALTVPDGDAIIPVVNRGRRKLEIAASLRFSQ